MGHYCFCDGQSFPPASAECCSVCIQVRKACAARRLAEPAFVLAIGYFGAHQRGLEDCADGLVGSEIRLLLYVSDAGALAYRDVACVCIFLCCKDFEQRALPRSIRTDEA